MEDEDDDIINYMIAEPARCVTSARCKRERTFILDLCAKEHTGYLARKPTNWKQRGGYTPMVPTEWRRPSQSEHLLQQSCWQGPLTVRRKLAVFFEADSENPAYLSQLLLQAGDVERNPGPVACGICSRKVTSNSIKCTWCGNWIHQRCSGLEKKDITKLAKAETYAFECHKCAVAPRFHPERELSEVLPRGNTCVHPAQELPSTDGLKRRDTSPAAWPHLDQESLLGKTRGSTTCINPVQEPREKKQLNREELPSRCFHPEQELCEVNRLGRTGCENPAQHPNIVNDSITKGKSKETRRGNKRWPTEEHREARRLRRKLKRDSKRETVSDAKPQQAIVKVATWNLQGISVHERNRARLKRAVKYMEQKKWEIALISEVRAKEQGVIWLGEDNEQVAVIHTQRSGIILRGDTLKAWVEEGQAKSFSERTTTIDVLNMRLIAVYQPLWSNGLEGIDTYRQYLDDQIASTLISKILILGETITHT